MCTGSSTQHAAFHGHRGVHSSGRRLRLDTRRACRHRQSQGRGARRRWIVFGNRDDVCAELAGDEKRCCGAGIVVRGKGRARARAGGCIVCAAMSNVNMGAGVHIASANHPASTCPPVRLQEDSQLKLLAHAQLRQPGPRCWVECVCSRQRRQHVAIVPHAHAPV